MNLAKKLSGLKKNPKNHRAISPAALAHLGESLDRFGDISGIVLNSKTGNLVCGHQRVAAMQQRYGDLDISPEGVIILPNGSEVRIRLVEMSQEEEVAALVAANNQHSQGVFLPSMADEIEALDLKIKESLGLELLLADLRDKSFSVEQKDSEATKTSGPAPVLHLIVRLQDASILERAIKKAGKKSMGECIAEICEVYINEH